MDGRSWPWKKKSSDKIISDKAVVLAEVPATQEKYKKPSYVQISMESYTHLTGLEDQVKSNEKQVRTMNSQIIELNEKLSAAQNEIVTKEGVAKQHAKVAEEAISGWEKAETEALTLKTHLEAVALEKLTAEDRAAHLDSALKECMRQIRNLKEEHDKELHDVIFSKTKQFEKLKLELESKMAKLGQELIKSEAENAALARSLQERCNMLIKISEQKSQAEAEIEDLKGNIESCERELSSLKYELHIAAKELEIRTEEKNMSVRSADVANKQHVDAAKKITKLEAECQRLRGLVRKKLPGPAALAQMKLEVESFGRDCQLEELHKIQKGNEFLTERVLTMEEDTKMLKEALAKRSIELQDSRDLCASISYKLQSLEAEAQTDSKSTPKLANAHSLTSMSEDGNEYAPSSAESWSTGLNSDLSQCKHGKSQNHLELMDDFLEMEKLACCQSSYCELKKIHCSDASCDRQICPEDACMTTSKEISSSQDSKPVSENTQTISQEIAADIHQIHHFVVSLGKAAEAVQDRSPDSDGLVEQVKDFSAKFSRALYEKTSVVDFVADLSHILHRADELQFNFLGLKENGAETSGSDCIDKVALPEHKVVTVDIMGDTYGDGCSGSGSDPEVPCSGNPPPGMELKSTTCMCSMEDFEKIKMEKENLEIDLVRCSKDLENVQSKLTETEGKLSELSSQLDLAQKSNSFAETQLKCMVESYRSLERRAEELDTELSLFREKAETLEHELQEEKTQHQDTMEKCNDLQEQLQRNSVNLESATPDADRKTNQEKEVAAAAEKLAECQETIFLLGRQLKSLQPQPEPVTTPQQDIGQRVAKYESPNITFENMLDLDRGKMEAAASSGIMYRTGSESPMTDMYNALYIPIPSDSEASSYLRSPISAKHQKHKLPHPAQTSEKHSRGISRFFSTKGKF